MVNALSFVLFSHNFVDFVVLSLNKFRILEGFQESRSPIFVSKGIFNSLFCIHFFSSSSKTLLKLTIPRIKLLRNRREIQLKQMRKDIAKLLENGQEATARIRVKSWI
jgi:Regulator of Vps4 activity in the MVB pathway